MWYDEEFYTEPSEFDMQVEEFKESLARSVKEEFLEEMERLRKENQNLQEIKENFEQIKRDYDKKTSELRMATQNAAIKAKRMRAEEIMEKYKIFLWRPNFVFMYGPKCDKCNSNRQIEISLPSGKKVMDDCECRDSLAQVAVPERMMLYKLADRDEKVVAWYKPCGEEGKKYYCSDYARAMYADEAIVEPGTSFDVLMKEGSRKSLFRTKEECLAYCKYLNETNKIMCDTIYKCNGEKYKEEED